ncbi:unnamed protein product [Parnassius mnemosyne]|uniref:Peptidase aspartic putative domain-containing protein n=1 Tax=Parnassius mnemosyne TaxID=213953 RepID=A0AAV1LP42_9NEOP
MHNNYNIQISCYVINEITGDLPKCPIDKKQLNLPTHIELADPSFDQPSSIHMLIGADIFWDILKSKQRSLGLNRAKLISSHLGWLIAGPIPLNSIKQRQQINKTHCNHIITNQNKELSSFARNQR